MSSLDLITIDGLEVDCVVGVYPREREQPQRLRVDLELGVDTRQAAVMERLGATIDYAVVAAQVRFLLQSCRFHMLETAAHAIARFLLAPPAAGESRRAIERVRVKLTKPDALTGGALASINVLRSAEEVVLEREQSAFGHVDIVHETREAGIYRLNIAPGKGIPLHVHRKMREAELVLTRGVLCQGEPALAGSVFRWEHDVAHRYDNPTDHYQTILCVDSPPFIREDEVEVEVEGALVKVTPEQAWPADAPLR